MFRNPNIPRKAVPFTAAILAMAVLFTLAIMATSLHVKAQQTGLSRTDSQKTPHVLRFAWPAIEIASATYEILEEIL